MARKTAIVTISAEGRDKGKKFLITEMPASKAERWGHRALLALARTGIEIPDNVMQSGIAGMAAMGIDSLVRGGPDYVEVEPLLNEMMQCVSVIRGTDPKNLDMATPLFEDDDIEEVATRLLLRAEVWKLHTDFLSPGK